MNTYRYENTLYASYKPLPIPSGTPAPGEKAIFLRTADPKRNRLLYASSDPGRYEEADGIALLDGKCEGEEEICAIVNYNDPRWLSVKPESLPKKARVHLVALGDVGSTLALGLKLLGGSELAGIGFYDMDPNRTKRWEMELGQIRDPGGAVFPPSYAIKPEELFDCDVFIFTASRMVPAVGADVKDVRMAQFSANRLIVSEYARLAREALFSGLFAVVSDPVDLLARTVYEESNQNEEGIWDFGGLRPEQIQGFGLGVMHARACFADPSGQYEREGRAFGPHGEGLVIINSLTEYDALRSAELTKSALTANLAIREIGFKPYVAPAISSGALSILAALRGEWHYGSVYLGGNYIGCRNRFTPYGLQTEAVDLPDGVMERLQRAEQILEESYEEIH